MMMVMKKKKKEEEKDNHSNNKDKPYQHLFRPLQVPRPAWLLR